MPWKEQLSRSLKTELLEGRALMAASIFVHPDLGDDANSGYEENYAIESTTRLESDYQGADRISLSPGDELVFLEGTLDQSVVLRGLKGTAEQPIRLTARPGAKLAPTVREGVESNAIYLYDSEHVIISGFDVTSKGNGIFLASSSNITVQNNYIHDVDGIANDNMAGVHIVGGDNIHIAHNFFVNNFQRERPGNQNNRHFVAFGATNVTVSNNVMWNELDDVGAGAEYKHLGKLGPDAEAPFTFTHNIVANANGVSVGTSAPNSVIRENLILDSGYVVVADRGGSHHLSNEVIEWNTIVNRREGGDTAGLFVGTSENPGYPLGEIQFNHNVVHDTRDYNHSDRSTMNLHRYGDDSYYQRLVEDGLFSADGNVYDTAHSAQFDVFGSDIRGNKVGFKDSFLAWQSLGYDRHGVETNSGLDHLYQPLDNARPAAGWLDSGTAKLVLLNESWSVSEGESTTLQLVRSGVSLAEPMSVRLSVSVDNVEVPAVVTIPAGEQSVAFEVSALTDQLEESTEAVQILAESQMFDASTWLQVLHVAPTTTIGDNDEGERFYCVPIEPPVFVATDVEDVDAVLGEVYGPQESGATVSQDNSITESLDVSPSTEVRVTWQRVNFNPHTSEAGDSRFVYLKAGDHEVYFDTLYGGTPTTYARDGRNVIASFPGLGFGGNINTGQDGTQASANGIAFNPIAQLNDPETTALYNYYGRETELIENADQSVSYTVRGFMPNFWQSHEMRDDAIPTFPGVTDHNWITVYHDRGDAAAVRNDPTVPVIFEGSADQPIGYNFIGNELLADSLPWNQRLFSIPEGRVAFKTNVSLTGAGDDAWAGIRFRSQVPTYGAADIHDAYQADGYSLNVNKFGDLQLLRQQGGVSNAMWTGSLANLKGADVNQPGGVVLEVRTHNGQPGWMQILVNGQAVAELNDTQPILGEHNGLVASTTDGRIRFGNREFFDVSYEQETTYTLRTDGQLELDMEVRLAEGVSSPATFYRAGQHVYIDPSLFDAQEVALWGDSEEGRVSQPEFLVSKVTPSLGGLHSLWIGKADSSFGLSARVLNASGGLHQYFFGCKAARQWNGNHVYALAHPGF
ncbi:MAG: right-handed parallel beta-helix repeat-containing protein [Planctomycetota bacterium]